MSLHQPVRERSCFFENAERIQRRRVRMLRARRIDIIIMLRYLLRLFCCGILSLRRLLMLASRMQTSSSNHRLSAVLRGHPAPHKLSVCACGTVINSRMMRFYVKTRFGVLACGFSYEIPTGGSTSRDKITQISEFIK